MGSAGPRPGEAYRLRQANAGTGKMVNIVPFSEDERLFDTYAAAACAAAEHRKRFPSVITQAVVLDNDGRVVFPPDGLDIRSRGRWHIAPTLWRGPRAKTGRKRKRRPPGAPRLVTGRPRDKGSTATGNASGPPNAP